MQTPFKIILTLFIAAQSLVAAQSKLNDYKYFSVADRFDFLKESDQYQVNSLTKFLLKKNGFMVLESSDEYPQDLSSNRCLLALVDVVKVKGFLKTKLEVHFKDCYNKLIYKSEVGMSREKDFKTAYHEALRRAFKSIIDLNYQFKPSVNQAPTNEIATPDEKQSQPPAPQTTLMPESNPVPSIESKVYSSPPPPPPVMEPVKSIPAFQLKPTTYGFDVVEISTGRVTHSLHETMYYGVYIINNLPGMAYKRGNKWVREYISNQKTVIEPLF